MWMQTRPRTIPFLFPSLAWSCISSSHTSKLLPPAQQLMVTPYNPDDMVYSQKDRPTQALEAASELFGQRIPGAQVPEHVCASSPDGHICSVLWTPHLVKKTTARRPQKQRPKRGTQLPRSRSQTARAKGLFSSIPTWMLLHFHYYVSMLFDDPFFFFFFFGSFLGHMAVTE